ncbi:MAG: glycosyltransferase family 39 protein [Pirellulales bacterium]
MWLSVTAVYIGLFLAARLPSIEGLTGQVWRRWELVLVPLQPDELLAAWTGGSGAWSIADRLPVLALAATIVLVASAAGDLLLRLLRVARSMARGERVFFAATAGLNLVSLWTLAVGLAGHLDGRGWWFVPGLGVIVAWLSCAAIDARRRTSATNRDAPSRAAPTTAAATTSAEPQPSTADDSSDRSTIRFLLALAAPFAAVILLGGMLPPVEFDVREYHLEAPKEFYQRGRVEFLPHNVYANMPLGIEMHALAAMCISRDWWRGALVGKLISSALALLTALGLWAGGRRWGSSAAGALAALVYLSIPWVVQVATLGLVEAGTGCYLLATVLAASRLFSRTADQAREDRAGWILLTGFLAGGALATKYPAAVFVVLPVASLVAWTVWRDADQVERRRQASPGKARAVVVALALYGLAVAAGGGLWLAKNWALTGNPVYPLAYNWFDGATRTAELNAQWQQAHRPPNFELADIGRRVAGFVLTSEWLSPLVWPLAALGLVVLWRWSLGKVWLGYVAIFFLLWWLLTHRIDRFWVPVLPIVALLAGGAASWASGGSRRTALLTFVSLAALWNLLVVTSGIGGGDNRYLESLDRLKHDEGRLAPWHAYLNEHTPADQQVLSVGDAQVFDLEVPVLYNTVFDPSIFETIVRDERGALRPAAAIRERLRDVAFVYVNWSEIARYRSPGNYGFSDFVQPEVFERLVAEGVLAPAVPEFADWPVQIFPVRP